MKGLKNQARISDYNAEKVNAVFKAFLSENIFRRFLTFS